MFKEVKFICKFMDEFHTDHSFQQALCSRVDRIRFLHHDIDFSVAYGGRSGSRRCINCAKIQRQRFTIVDLINSTYFSQKY
jgi:hypothetical protein